MLSLLGDKYTRQYFVLANGKVEKKKKVCSNIDNLMLSKFLRVKATCYETGPSLTYVGTLPARLSLFPQN